MTAVFSPEYGHVVEGFSLVQRRLGEVERPGISGRREPIDGHAAGKADVVVLGHLVESLAARVVDRRPQDLDAVVTLHAGDDRMPAGDQHAEVRVGDVSLQVRRVQVRQDVVHPDQRLSQRPGKALRE